MESLTLEQASIRLDEIRAAYWRSVRRASGSWYTRSETMRRQGAARRCRVMWMRTMLMRTSATIER